MLPVGTANLVCREAGLPLRADADRIARALLGARAWPVGVMEARRPSGEVFRAVATIGVGLDAEVVRRAAEVRASAGGTGGYSKWIAPVLGALRDFPVPDLEVSVDGAPPVRGAAAIVQQSRAYAGFLRIDPEAALDSGRFTVVVLPVRRRRDLLRTAVGLLSGTLRRQRDAWFARGTSATIRASPPAAVQSDGDPAGTTDLSIRLLPSALTLLRASPAAASCNHLHGGGGALTRLPGGPERNYRT
jgi:diacylglycerol kinase family enzyme